MASQHLTNEEAGRILAYCKAVVRVLRLPDYEFQIHDDPTEDAGVAGSILSDRDMGLHAVVRVDVKWSEYGSDHKRRVLFHEVAHLLTRDLEHAMETMVDRSPGLSSEWRMMFYELVRYHCENMTSRMEGIGVWTEIMPPWPRKGPELRSSNTV